MNVNVSNPSVVNPLPAIRGAPSNPCSSRNRKTPWTVLVHGRARRSTTSPRRRASAERPPSITSSLSADSPISSNLHAAVGSVSPHRYAGGMAERFMSFEGVLNFRDLGGYECEDGRHTRWGRLFRSDAMHDLTEDDLVVFRGLGIETVVDLRSVSEVERTGRGLLALEGSRFINVPVLSNYEINEPRETA